MEAYHAQDEGCLDVHWTNKEAVLHPSHMLLYCPDIPLLVSAVLDHDSRGW